MSTSNLSKSTTRRAPAKKPASKAAERSHSHKSGSRLLSLWLDEETIARLNVESAFERITMSEYIRRAIQLRFDSMPKHSFVEEK